MGISAELGWPAEAGCRPGPLPFACTARFTPDRMSFRLNQCLLTEHERAWQPFQAWPFVQFTLAAGQ